MGDAGGVRLPFFATTCCFFFFFFAITLKNYKQCLFEVELIINNKPLTHVYSNTIETCFTLNHLLFGRQLPYSSKTT